MRFLLNEKKFQHLEKMALIGECNLFTSVLRQRVLSWNARFRQGQTGKLIFWERALYKFHERFKILNLIFSAQKVELIFIYLYLLGLYIFLFLLVFVI